MQETTLRVWFWVLLDIFVAAAIVNILFFVMPALSHLGASFAPARTITVTGEGKATVAPDTATISFSVLSRGKNPDDLSSANADKMNAVIQFVKSQGIGAKDIKTTGYNLSPDYAYDESSGRNYITGYTLTQTVTVKIRDFAKIPATIAGLTPLGVNEIGNVSFTLEDDASALMGARADAMKKVQEKAEQLISDSGGRLGRIVTISESQSVPPINYFGATAAMGLAAPAPAAPTIEPGTQDVTVNETVIYELE